MIEVIAVVLAAALLISLLGLYAAVRGRRDPAVSSRLDALLHDNERLERELRAAVDSTAGQMRLETGTRLSELQSHLVQQMTGLTGLQGQQLADLTRRIQLDLGEVRGTLHSQLTSLQQGNERKLDQMRETVEEKLQSTLEARLGESFRMVSERLEQVHKGLGEMQALASGVGDLKRMLTNVKSRGTYGEVQLASLLEQVLLVDQYARNVATRPNSTERVEFAVRMPGRDGSPCWLPIDAKFPVEDYDRLLTAVELGDAVALEAAGKALERSIKVQARMIREKYVESPHTTDFAIMFLPTEGLFAEVLRRPGLADHLHRECRTVVAGPDDAVCDAQFAADGISNVGARAALGRGVASARRRQDRVRQVRRSVGDAASSAVECIGHDRLRAASLDSDEQGAEVGGGVASRTSRTTVALCTRKIVDRARHGNCHVIGTHR